MEELLCQRWGEVVSLGNVEAFDDGHGVHRLEVLNGSPRVPQTIVVKVYDITLPERREAFLRELAGWRFLQEVCSDPKPIAQYYGSSPNDGFILLEDLHEWEKTSMLLRGDWSTRTELGIQPMPSSNGRIASQAMAEWWRALGRIHAATSGKRSVYEKIRASLGDVPDQPTVESQMHQMARGFRAMCEAIGISPHSGSEEDLGIAMEATLRPGPFEVFTHGDPCPDNALHRRNACRIIDLEESGYGHALSDATFIHTHWPTCWCASRLPDSVIQDLEDVYRSELIRSCPEAGDDALFYRSVVDISVIQAAKAWRPWTGTNLMDEDEDWGLATMRQRFVTRMEAAVARTQQLGYLEGIGATFTSMLSKLRDEWPPSQQYMPYFDAFS